MHPAIGGTKAGENIMSKLNFEIVVPGLERAERKDFFETECNMLIDTIRLRYHSAIRN